MFRRIKLRFRALFRRDDIGDELAAHALHQQYFEFARELLQIARRGVGGTYR